MHYRKAQINDIDIIIRLQSENLLNNLNPTDKRNGFLSVAFSNEQF